MLGYMVTWLQNLETLDFTGVSAFGLWLHLGYSRLQIERIRKMSSVRTEDILEEQQFFGDLWNYRKKHYNGEEPQEFWAALIDDAEAISRKYKNDYLDQMLLVCVDDVENRFKLATGNKYYEPDMLTVVYERLKKRRKEENEVQKR